MKLRPERFGLMEAIAELPEDMIFFTQITMEVAEDPEFLGVMNRARIKGALVGVETVTKEGLKVDLQRFQLLGPDLAGGLRRDNGVHVLGSSIFGLPTDQRDTFAAAAAAAAELADRAGLTFAQFVTMTPFPGTVDLQRWENQVGETPERIEGVSVTRY